MSNDGKVTEADMIAYGQMIDDAETKQELLEELRYIRDDLRSKADDDSDSGGRTLTKK